MRPAIVSGRRLTRGEHAVAAGQVPATRSPPPKLLMAIIALVAIGLAYFLARALFGLP